MATPDEFATANVVSRIVTKHESRPPSQLGSLTLLQLEEAMQIEFGRHQGEDISGIPTGYLKWLVNDFDIEPQGRELRGMPRGYKDFVREQRRDLVAAAEEELISRGEA